MRKFPEKDWKLFRSKIADWQEAYMDRLNHEYIELLSGGEDPSTKFWALVDRIKDDRHRVGVTVRMSRSEMIYIIAELVRDEAITLDDLEEFSEDCKDAIKMLLRIYDDDEDDDDAEDELENM